MSTPTPEAPTSERGYARRHTGAAGDWWGTLGSSESTPELRWPSSVAVYDAMRRQDAQVSSVLRAVMLPVIRTQWRVRADDASPEVTAHVARCLGLPVAGTSPEEQPIPAGRRRSRFSWARHLPQAMSCLVYGHSYFEQVYAREGDAWVIRKLAPRPQTSIRKIDVARDGGLVSITQRGTLTAGMRVEDDPVIGVDRLVAYVHDPDPGDWVGRSLLRPAYKNWLLKDRLLRLGVTVIERNGMGVPRYIAAPNESDLTAGEELAQAWRSGEAAGGAIPNGASLDLVGVSGDLPDGLPWVRYLDEQIARAVLAHFLNLGTETGSWALGSTFADFFTHSLQAVADEIADTATAHVVEDLVDVQWGPDEPAPSLVCDEIGSRRELTDAALKQLVESGVVRPDRDLEDYVREAWALPPKQVLPTTTPSTAESAALTEA